MDTEAEPMSLIRSVIGILSQNDNFHISDVTHLGPREHLLRGWIDLVMFSFFSNKSHELITERNRGLKSRFPPETVSIRFKNLFRKHV